MDLGLYPYAKFHLKIMEANAYIDVSFPVILRRICTYEIVLEIVVFYIGVLVFSFVVFL